jgi:hypothetical protein
MSIMTKKELQQHLNDIQLWYLQDPDCSGILFKKLLNKEIIKHDKVRELFIMFGPRYAYWYASQIDQCQRSDTRNAACNNSKKAYWYAYYIDKCATPETRSAAYKDPLYKEVYIQEFGE